MNFRNTLKYTGIALLCALLLVSCDKTTEEKPVDKGNTQTEDLLVEGENNQADEESSDEEEKYNIPLVTSIEITDDVPGEFHSVIAMSDGVFKVLSSDLSLGLMKADGKLILPCRYSTARNINDKVAAIRDDMGMWGYFNIESEGFISECVNDSVYDFSEGIGCYSPDGEVYRFIHTDGAIAIDRDFFEAAPFSDGLARVFSEIGVGYINKNGEMEIYCDYDDFDDFHEGMARVAEAGKFGYIGKDGKLRFNMNTTGIYQYKDGVAAFTVGNLIGYIDKESKVTAEPIYNAPNSKLTDEYFRYECGVAPVLKDGKYGFINKDGELVIDTIYDEALYAVDGIIRVKTDSHYGYITTSGEKITDCIFDEAGIFRDGVAKVRKDGFYYYINKEGTELCSDRFIDASEFTGNTAFVIKQGNTQWTKVVVKE